MKVDFQELSGGSSYHEAAEMLVAELRERRKRLQQLIRLVHEAAAQDLQTSEAKHSFRPMRYKCRGGSPARRMAGAA